MPTPAADAIPRRSPSGKQIFVYFKSGNLAALDPLGKVMWSKNLQKAYAKDGLKWDLGTVSCLDAETGKVLWETVLPKGPAIYYASPMIAGDWLYCGRSDGTIYCGRITEGGLVDVNTNELRESLVATPVAIGDSLVVRTHEHLWCFR